MAAGVGGVLTTLLIILIFLQLRSVLYYQKLDDGVIMTFGTNYPSHTSKISYFGKDILQHLISNTQCSEKSSSYRRNVRTIPIIGFLYLILSGDIKLNHGPLCIGCKENSLVPPGNTVNSELEWICDNCYDLDQSTDDLMTNLPKGVIFGHINACGILSKIDQLKIILRKQFFDIFAVTESKLDHNIDDAEIEIKGYTVFRRDRNRHGGGVLFYINDKWSVTNVISHEHLEFLSLDIKQLNSPTMKTGVVYRPPDSIVQWYSDFESAWKNY